jgi:hypothetical protein
MLATNPPAIKAPALTVPETSFLQICNAASHVHCADRSAFLAAVRDALGNQPPNEGAIGRAIAVAFRTYWKAPQLQEAPRPRAYFKRAG